MLAIVNTIHASHTAGIVNLMVLIVYARSLAALGAKRTVAAFVGIYNRFEKSMARKNAKHRAHGTNGVAISTTVAPRKNHHHNQSYSGKNKSGKRTEPYFALVESITSRTFRNVCEQIVTPYIYRRNKVCAIRPYAL